MKEQNEGMARPSWNSLLSDERPSKTFVFISRVVLFSLAKTGLSWIVTSLLNQNSHSFGNNTHSVENKDFFFSSKTI